MGTDARVDNNGAEEGNEDSARGRDEEEMATTAGDRGIGKRKRPVHVRLVSASGTYAAIAPPPGSIGSTLTCHAQSSRGGDQGQEGTKDVPKVRTSAEMCDWGRVLDV